MTHEPDIIREKRNVIRAALKRERTRNQQILDNDWDLYGIPKDVKDRWQREDDVHFTVRVAADEQRDYGDEHKERA